jgi:hypothetical protein
MLVIGTALTVGIGRHSLLENRGFFSGFRSFLMAPWQVLSTEIRSMYMETLMIDRFDGGFESSQQLVWSR